MKRAVGNTSAFILHSFPLETNSIFFPNGAYIRCCRHRTSHSSSAHRAQRVRRRKEPRDEKIYFNTDYNVRGEQWARKCMNKFCHYILWRIADHCVVIGVCAFEQLCVSMLFAHDLGRCSTQKAHSAFFTPLRPVHVDIFRRTLAFSICLSLGSFCWPLVR